MLEPVTPHQEIEGAAQSDYFQFHLPQLYMGLKYQYCYYFANKVEC